MFSFDLSVLSRSCRLPRSEQGHPASDIRFSPSKLGTSLQTNLWIHVAKVTRLSWAINTVYSTCALIIVYLQREDPTLYHRHTFILFPLLWALVLRNGNKQHHGQVERKHCRSNQWISSFKSHCVYPGCSCGGLLSWCTQRDILRIMAHQSDFSIFLRQHTPSLVPLKLSGTVTWHHLWSCPLCS